MAFIARNRHDRSICGRSSGDGGNPRPGHRENRMAATSLKLEPGQVELGQTELIELLPGYSTVNPAG